MVINIFFLLLQVQALVSRGLLFRFLGVSLPHCGEDDTPFVGSVVVGSITATVATLGDLSRVLLVAAAARVCLDLVRIRMFL